MSTMTDQDIVEYARESDLRNDPLVQDLASEVARLRAALAEADESCRIHLMKRHEGDRSVERAEAALARVTDDSMAERIAHAFMDSTGWKPKSPATLGAQRLGRTVLATIRAVAADSESVVTRDDSETVAAADEQEAHNHKPTQHRDGKEPWCRICGLTADGREPRSRFEEVAVAVADHEGEHANEGEHR